MRNSPILILAVIIILLSAGGFFLIKGGDRGDDLVAFRDVTLPDTSATTPQAAEAPSDVPKALAESTPQTEVVSADTRSYKNTAFHFSLLYPKELKVTEYKEKGNSLTVTFSDQETGESFQIYVRPYSDKQITTGRFKFDEPSGVYQQPTDVFIDTVRATMFFSKNAVMGDTREVWFIHGGLLYEVTTYKDLDTWLGQIMQTWKFI